MVPLTLFLLALGARMLGGALFLDPGYPDAFYYVSVAQSLAAGNGFQVGYIWNFVDTGTATLPDVGVLPIVSNAHWMPLAAIIQVPFIWLLGPTALASALPFWLTSAAVAPLTWWIGRDAGLAPWQAAAAAVMVAVPALVAPFLAQPDNFGPFMLLGTLALWLCARGLRGDRRAFVLGGVVVGFAFLSRNDGILLGIPFALAFLVELLRRSEPRRIGWTAAVLCALGFVLVATPWLVRQLTEFGSISPSATSGRITWLRAYAELYSVSTPATLQTFLDQGVGPLVTSRVLGLVNALGLFALQPLLIFLAPFTLLGAWWRRRDHAFQPWLVYAGCLFLASGLVFAVHVPHGTFLHSAVALMPYAYLASVVGIGGVVAAVGRRRPGWDVQRATRLYTWTAVGAVVALGVVSSVTVANSWRNAQDIARAAVAPLATVDPSERLMSSDAGAFWYLAARPGVVTPEDPLSVVEDVARRYDIRWLLLERAFMTRALGPVFLGEERPDWLSAPLATVTSPTDPDRIEAALYAVCLSPDDLRCTP
ncbi:MAG: glycosyltransferase family 39 protein [Chloroflexi bacterium]|nr:glycosyltransferase family 39 protein [Chloroflexota bacterium]